jgi:hypothetical protein
MMSLTPTTTDPDPAGQLADQVAQIILGHQMALDTDPRLHEDSMLELALWQLERAHDAQREGKTAWALHCLEITREWLDRTPFFQCTGLPPASMPLAVYSGVRRGPHTYPGERHVVTGPKGTAWDVHERDAMVRHVQDLGWTKVEVTLDGTVHPRRRPRPA